MCINAYLFFFFWTKQKSKVRQACETVITLAIAINVGYIEL